MSDDVLSTMLGMLTKEQKEELAAKLIADVGNLQPEDQKEQVIQPVSSPRTVNEDFTVTNSKSNVTGGKRPVKAKQNTWHDEGEKKDPNYNPEEYESIGRKSRSKEPRNSIVKKKCYICNNEFEISSSLIYGKFHRCNNCTG